MRTYHNGLVQRANQIGLVTEAAFLDACQELIDAATAVDLGSVYSAHLRTVQFFGEAAQTLFKSIHDWRKGGL